ncbi:MAG: ASKHA domain-containing protein [Bdellovibrionota bacterium]
MKIKVDCRGESLLIDVPAGFRLLEGLSANEIPVNAACGGNGSCQKCRVQVKDGFVGVTASDRKAFSASEIGEGWRLSCQAIVRTNMSCLVPDVESLRAVPRLVKHATLAEGAVSPRLVCDLGSTGVVVAIGDEKGRSLVEAHLLNQQVRFGADVMSRLKAVQDKGILPLHDSLVKTLGVCLNALSTEAPDLFAKAFPHGLFCSGNSALVSFLHSWDTQTLAVSPFQPLSTEASTTQSAALGLDLHSLPLLGGFVGADTFAGLLALKDLSPEEPWMLVDVGTNTEIVVAAGDRLWFSSAPAGPAFEGGNIALGMRAEPGAIAHAYYIDGEWRLETIGSDKAKGICGSGIVDAIFEGVKAGLLSADGFLPGGRLSIGETVYLLADDVREFQLAKSATRTACDLLVKRAGVVPKTLYLAGTFADHLRADAARGTGLLPPDATLVTLGNASLRGTLLWAAASASLRESWTREIKTRATPVELALQDDFQDAFIKNLNF